MLLSEKWVLAALLLFTLLVRGGVLWAMRAKLQDDPDPYREIAENLLKHGEFALGKATASDPQYHPRSTAYRPPLYPIVLSNLPTADGQHVSLVKVAGLHLLLGVATVWLTWLTARRVGCAHHCEFQVGTAHPTTGTAGIAHPTIAGLIVACDPILLNQQALIMTETLAAFLAILSLWCLARFDGARTPFNAALAGGTIGLAALCRPTFLPWLGLVGIMLLAVRGRKVRDQRSEARDRQSPFLDFCRRLSNFVGLVIAAAAVMLPWAIRNYRVFGRPIVTTTHGGYTLLLGNNPSFYGWLLTDRDGLPWDARQLEQPKWSVVSRVEAADNVRPSVFMESSDELTMDESAYRVAMHTIRARPGLFFYSCAYRVTQLWSPLPNRLTADESAGRQALRYGTCAWYCGVYVLAGMGLWRLRWRLFQPPWIWGVLLCLAFTAVHTFYWTNLRMRAPLMPFVALIAGAAVNTSPKRGRG